MHCTALTIKTDFKKKKRLTQPLMPDLKNKHFNNTMCSQDIHLKDFIPTPTCSVGSRAGTLIDRETKSLAEDLEVSF